MVIATATLTAAGQKNALSDAGYLLCHPVPVDDSADRNREIGVLPVFAVTELQAAWLAVAGDNFFGVPETRQSPDIGHAVAPDVTAVAAGRACRTEFHHVPVESYGTIAAVTGLDLYRYVVYQHGQAIWVITIPYLPAFDKGGTITAYPFFIMTMKKLVGLLAAVALAGAPLLANASTFVARDVYSTSAQETMSGNTYAVGGTVTISSDVDGDLVVLGGNLTTTGHVSDDLMAGGGNIQVLGPVSGDVRVAGGQVTINDMVGGELLVAGGTVHILANSVIEGDLHVVGGQVVLDGAVRGKAVVYSGRLTVNGTVGGSLTAKASDKLVVGPDARIGGALKYNSPSEADIASGARIGGKISYEPMASVKVNREAPKAIFWAAVGALTAVRTLALLGLTILLVWLWRRQSLDVMQEAKDSFWPSLGKGLVYAILTPIVALLLIISLIGMLPGFLLVMAYIALMILAKVMAGMFVGAYTEALIKKRPNLRVSWLNAILGVIGLVIIGMIPFIGWLVVTAVCLMLFGVMAQRGQKMLV